MGTGITDARGELASSGAGIPAFIGVLDKAVKRILELNPRSDGDSPRATSSSRTIRTTAASRISTTSCSRCRCSPAATSSPGPRTSPTGTTSAAWCPARCRARRREIFQEGLRLPAVKLIDEGEPNRSVMEIMKVNAGCPTFSKATCGPASRRSASASGGSSNSSSSTARTRSSQRWRTSWTTASRCRVRALRELPKGRFELERSRTTAASTSVAIEITDDEFVVDLRDNPDQDAGPNNASRDGAMIAAQMIFKNVTDPQGVANAGHVPLRCRLITRPGSVFDAEPPAAFAIYYEVEIRLYDLIWRCLAPHLGGPPARRQLRVDLRHRDLRHPPRHRPALHDHRAADRRLGRVSRPRRKQRDLQRLPRRDLQLPGRGRGGALRPLRRPPRAQRRAWRRRRSIAAARESCSSTASGLTEPT